MRAADVGSFRPFQPKPAEVFDGGNGALCFLKSFCVFSLHLQSRRQCSRRPPQKILLMRFFGDFHGVFEVPGCLLGLAPCQSDITKPQ